MNRIASLAFGWALFLAPPAQGHERIDICAKFVPSGKAYHVQATSISGTELNTATQSFNYNSWSTYVVVFWSENQATVIEMDSWFGQPSMFGTDGRDQENRTWTVSSYSAMQCGW